MELPEDTATPVICVGPGTGVAPMRALIGDRISDGAKGINLSSIPSSDSHRINMMPGNFLYFGCRSASKDHHYAEEWRKLELDQNLTYRVAFSRDGEEGKRRIYVQDLMAEDAKTLWDLIQHHSAWIYISG